jgi:hypothetical protein
MNHLQHLASISSSATLRCLIPIVTLCCITHCAAYDPALLAADGSQRCGDGRVDDAELCDTAIAKGQPGACPTRCTSDDSCAPAELRGEGCLRQCVLTLIETARDEDGCCPEGVTAAADVDCAACGDGVIGPGEVCDPPGSCLQPEACTSPNACIMVTFSGGSATCDARCELRSVTACEGGDGCCPPDCDRDSDSDCSDACGDGIVDRETETCEPSSEAEPCPRNCDDGDACTDDRTIGSPENCNFDCTHTTITSPRNADGCCPRMASGLVDDDCRTECGNGRLDPGEDCDGENDCTRDCRRASSEQCSTLMRSAEESSAECAQCACALCAEEVVACRGDDDATQAAACSAAVACIASAGCEGSACYCGQGVACAIPDGPCEEPFETAAGSNNPVVVLGCATNRACRAYPVFAYQRCLMDNCAAQCP